MRLYMQFRCESISHVIEVPVINPELKNIHKFLSKNPSRRFWMVEGIYAYSLKKEWAISRAKTESSLSRRISEEIRKGSITKIH